MTGALFDADTMWGLLEQRAAGDTRRAHAPRRRRPAADVRRVQGPRRAGRRRVRGARRRGRHAGDLAAADPDRDRRRRPWPWPGWAPCRTRSSTIYREREVGFALRQTAAAAVPRARHVARVRLRGDGRDDRPGDGRPATGAGGLRLAARRRPRDAPAAAVGRRRRDPLDLLHVGHHVGPEGRPAHGRDAARRRAGAGGGAWASHRRTTSDRSPSRSPTSADPTTWSTSSPAGSPPCCSRRSCRPRPSRSSGGTA